MRTTSLLALTALAGLALTTGVALAEGLPPGFGIDMPSGSKVTTTIAQPGDDTDDYIFRGYPGQKVTVTLKVAKQSDANLSITLLRPDGTEVSGDDDGAKTKSPGTVTVIEQIVDGTGTVNDVEVQKPLITKLQYVLDQVGVWKVRIDAPTAQIPGGDSGEYTISIKYTKPPKTKIKNPDPKSAEQYEFAIPAEGGSTISFSDKFKGANLSFNSLTAPGGTLVSTPTLNSKAGRSISAKKIVIPTNLPQGDYLLAIDIPAGGVVSKSVFSATVKLPRAAKKRKGRIDGKEPFITGGINPAVGGPGTIIGFRAIRAYDDNDQSGNPTAYVGGFELENVTIEPSAQGGHSVTGVVPGDVPEGTFSVAVETSTGQVGVDPDSFDRVPPPDATSIDPTVGSAAGGYEVTIRGSNFRPGSMGVLIDGFDVPVAFVSQAEDAVVFIAPPRAPTKVTFGVRDTVTQLPDSLPINSFEYLATPGISRITPGLIPVVGGDSIFISGSNFTGTDKVFMETATPNQFVEITASQTTFQNDRLHSFTAPILPKGSYEIYVQDAQGTRTSGTRTVDYFTFADFTPNLGFDDPEPGDLHDAWTTDVADFNGDGSPDLFLAQRGTGGRQSTAQIQVFENDGSGGFTDVSADVIPAPSGDDDWRADRIWVTDVNEDNFADIVIATRSDQVPAQSKSHVRILQNQRRSSSSEVSDRVFRDRTIDLMAPTRVGKNGVSNSSGDNWRATDMWVGDIDRGPKGPPEILITSDITGASKEVIDVQCGNYCSSNIGGALYRFYFSSSAMFEWDKNKRGGQGQYKFDPDFFPRKSGVLVPIGNPPPGVVITGCNTGTPCRGAFTPFAGEKIEVGDMNADGKPDIMVIGNLNVTKNGASIPSLQVAINGFNTSEGSAITDVTPLLTSLGGDFKADAGTIARMGYPDGNSFGTMVISKRAAVGGGSIRLIRFKPPLIPEDVAAFEDITNLVLPPTTANDKFQASAFASTDIDQDGDIDLVFVADAGPGVGEPAFRVMRNVIENFTVGILRSSQLEGLITPLIVGDEFFDGSSMETADLDGDGALEFIITRRVPVGDGTQTRVITIDK